MGLERLGGGGLSRKGKGLVDRDKSVVIAERGGGMRGLNGNGKNILKVKLEKKSKKSNELYL